MRFVAAYCVAVMKITCALSVVYFLLCLTGGRDFLPVYLAYVAAFAGIAGPIAEAMKD